jgi:AcrR family transcriptional regulator
MPTATRSTSALTTAAVATGGRPRDTRIDDAVLRATTELLVEVGYLRLTVGAVAERAGTTKPAIYRRWPTKAQLVHEAAFPIEGRAEAVPAGADLRSDIKAVVTIGVKLLSRPAARAALAGLMAERAGDSTLQATIFGRSATGTWGWLHQRISGAIAAGEVRSDVTATAVLELIAGSTVVAAGIQPAEELGADWVEALVGIVVRGIEA